MKNYLKHLFFICFLFFCVHPIKAQVDTSFWFAAPEVTSAHGDRPIYLRFTALNQDATITITQPANNFFVPIVVNINANSSQSIDLTTHIDVIETKPSDLNLNYGLHIISTAPITAYYEEASNNNPEIFALKGKNALGNNFMIPAQNLMNNANWNPTPYSSFIIIATEDATDVTITPTANVVGHTAGIPYTITLNKGQVYCAQSTSQASTNHLMGSTVTSSKPIAITISDDSIGGLGQVCQDLAGDQIIPIALLGTKYISLPGLLTFSPLISDIIFVLAIEDNTTVSFNGVVATTLNKAQTFSKYSLSEVFYIESSKPIYVLHLSGFGCEVGHTLLPQLECSGSKTVGVTRANANPFWLNVLVPTGGEGNFTFNGDPNIIQAAQFQTVPNTNGLWKFAQLQLSLTVLPQGNGGIIKNSTTDFHLGLIHGGSSTGCRYGYFSGYNRFDAISTSNASSNNPKCSGDTLKLFCDVGWADGITYSWTGPNGFTSTLQNPIIPNVQTNQSGLYTVVATKAGCNTITTATTVIINQSASVIANANAVLCEKETLNLQSTSPNSGVTFSWLGPNGFTATSANTTIPNITLAASGKYYVSCNNNGCIAKDSVTVLVKPLPSAIITTTDKFCKFSDVHLINNNTIVPAVYAWSGTNNFSANTQNIVLNNYETINVGKYVLSINANGCIAKDSITTLLNELPILQFDTVATFCNNDSPIQLNVTETTGIIGNGLYAGNGVSASGLFSPVLAGVGLHNITYTFTSANGCVSSKQQAITVGATPVINAGNDAIIISGSSIVLNASITGNSDTIKWTPNYNLSNNTIINPIAFPTTTTLYFLNVSTAQGCMAIDSVKITVFPTINIPNAFSPNGDGLNDTWVIESLNAFPKASVEVYNRNGSVVFRQIGMANWDGKYNGKPVPIGVYYYFIQLNNDFYKQPFTGFITVIK